MDLDVGCALDHCHYHPHILTWMATKGWQDEDREAVISFPFQEQHGIGHIDLLLRDLDSLRLLSTR